MEVLSYLTIAEATTGLYKEKGSKFIAFAYPLNTESDIKEKIDALKKEYFDARHHCYAWILGVDKKHFRAFDDGEPNHSAGDPILGQIRSKNLINVLVVVVRYFGGVKLGVGGLISAYKAAAEDALNKALVVEIEVKQTIHISYDYSSTPEVMRLIKEFDLTILKQKFDDMCVLHFEVRVRDMRSVIDKIKLLEATGADIDFCQPGLLYS